MNNRFFLLFGIVIVALGFLFWKFGDELPSLNQIVKYEDDKPAAPTPVPTPEPVDLGMGVTIFTPVPEQSVLIPFEVRGTAPGNWFFEGQLTGQVLSTDNQVLATFPLTTQGEWMTEESVEFSGTANFDYSNILPGITLVIKTDNPSGLPENEKAVYVPLMVYAAQ